MTEVSELSNDNAITLRSGVLDLEQLDHHSLDPDPPRRDHAGNSLRRLDGDGRPDPAADQAGDQRPARPDQLPILGALFRSQDFVNNETELMVIVTPYVVRAVAQKELSRPDDGFAPPRTRSPTLLGRINRLYGVAAASIRRRTTAAISASSSTETETGTRKMTTRRPSDRRRAIAPRGRARRLSPSCSAPATPRATRHRRRFPTDYRQRHPIAVQEAEARS